MMMRDSCEVFYEIVHITFLYWVKLLILDDKYPSRCSLTIPDWKDSFCLFWLFRNS